MLDEFERILNNLHNNCFDDSNDSNALLDVLIFIRCIFTSILDLLTFIDVFLFSRSKKLFYSI